MNSNLAQVIGGYNDFRDRIAQKAYREWEFESSIEYAYVLTGMFRYGFNTYKAIGLLLPDLYYEHAASLLRTLWEMTLDFHWIAKEPEERARQFLQFTVVEARKRVVAANDNEYVKRFDQAVTPVLKNYQYLDKKGRTQFFREFSNCPPAEMARELGGDWSKEYNRIYTLTCAYVHAAPSAILLPTPSLPNDFRSTLENDEERTAKVAVWSMAVMSKLYTKFCDDVGTDDSEYLANLNKILPIEDAFQVF
jgi:hypothetical protein